MREVLKVQLGACNEALKALLLAIAAGKELERAVFHAQKMHPQAAQLRRIAPSTSLRLLARHDQVCVGHEAHEATRDKCQQGPWSQKR